MYNISKNQYNILFIYGLFFIILLYFFRWCDYLVEHGYIYMSKIKEGYTSSNNSNNSNKSPSIPGNDDDISKLTGDIGSNAAIYNHNKLGPPVQANFGKNTWIDKFNENRQLFNERYKPSGLENLPSYPNRPSATGQFTDEGPLAANAYLQ